MLIELTPEQIVILHSATRKITELADRSPVISDAIGIDQCQRRILRELTAKIHRQATQKARQSPLNRIEI